MTVIDIRVQYVQRCSNTSQILCSR